MKSFRLISLQIAHDEEITDIELKEGLIINKEDAAGGWLIEAFIEEKYASYFEEARSQEQDVIVQVVITKKENDPAAFKTKIRQIKKVNGYASILLEGHLTRIKSDYPALLLEHLIEEGLSGDELIQEFKKSIVARPKIVLPKKV